jgi:hypothetical protein
MKVGLELNAEKAKYIIVSCKPNTVVIYTNKIWKVQIFGNNNQNYIRQEIQIR